jgi:Na+/H+ antiporter NhaD/arsenite permease-like protein
LPFCFLVLSLAGNLTPVGSVANVILLEQARKMGAELGFRQFVRHGVPITLVTLTVSMALLLLQHAWLE